MVTPTKKIEIKKTEPQNGGLQEAKQKGNPLLSMDWKIGFYRWYFTNISDIGQPWKDIKQHYRTRGISKKSPKYVDISVNLKSINQRKNRVWSDARSNRGSLSKYWRYIDDISDILDTLPIYLKISEIFLKTFFKKKYLSFLKFLIIHIYFIFYFKSIFLFYF